MFTLIITIIIVGSVAYASLLEYLLHRYVMHQPVKGFTYPFETHTKTHHFIFKADRTYHLIDTKDKWTIPMAWWNGPVLVLIATVPPLIISLITWNWWIIIISFAVTALYYGTYEYIHWCMHLPLSRRRVVEMSPFIGWIFFRLNGHHLLHHRYMGKNFNVVFPLWDVILCTMILRSKFKFNQARGVSVPDVQPRI